MGKNLDDYLLIRTIQKGDCDKIDDSKQILYLKNNPGKIYSSIDAFFVDQEDHLHMARFDGQGNFLYRYEVDENKKDLSSGFRHATHLLYGELFSFLILFSTKMTQSKDRSEITGEEVFIHSLIGLIFYLSFTFRKENSSSTEEAWKKYQDYLSEKKAE